MPVYKNPPSLHPSLTPAGSQVQRRILQAVYISFKGLALVDRFTLNSGIVRKQLSTDSTCIPCWPLFPLFPHGLSFFTSWSLLNLLQSDFHSTSEVVTKPISIATLQGFSTRAERGHKDHSLLVWSLLVLIVFSKCQLHASTAYPSH